MKQVISFKILKTVQIVLYICHEKIFTQTYKNYLIGMHSNFHSRQQHLCVSSAYGSMVQQVVYYTWAVESEMLVEAFRVQTLNSTWQSVWYCAFIFFRVLLVFEWLVFWQMEVDSITRETCCKHQIPKMIKCLILWTHILQVTLSFCMNSGLMQGSRFDYKCDLL